MGHVRQRYIGGALLLARLFLLLTTLFALGTCHVGESLLKGLIRADGTRSVSMTVSSIAVDDDEDQEENEEESSHGTEDDDER